MVPKDSSALMSLSLNIPTLCHFVPICRVTIHTSVHNYLIFLHFREELSFLLFQRIFQNKNKKRFHEEIQICIPGGVLLGCPINLAINSGIFNFFLEFLRFISFVYMHIYYVLL